MNAQYVFVGVALLSGVVYLLMFLVMVVQAYHHLKSRQTNLSNLSASAQERAKVSVCSHTPYKALSLSHTHFCIIYSFNTHAPLSHSLNLHTHAHIVSPSLSHTHTHTQGWLCPVAVFPSANIHRCHHKCVLYHPAIGSSSSLLATQQRELLHLQ